MIERRWYPCCRRVARLAVMVEIRGDMVGVRRSLIVRLMALVAIGKLDLIIPVRMACRALRGRVFAGERECRDRMIECRRTPCYRRMARLAIMAEIPGNVVRIYRCLEIALMTLVTARIRKLVIAICVAPGALRGRVFPRQRECSRGMIERCRGPC